jgi:hypothetical protein
MGNGMLPNGPSYRARPRLYPRHVCVRRGYDRSWMHCGRDLLAWSLSACDPFRTLAPSNARRISANTLPPVTAGDHTEQVDHGDQKRQRRADPEVEEGHRDALLLWLALPMCVAAILCVLVAQRLFGKDLVRPWIRKQSLSFAKLAWHRTRKAVFVLWAVPVRVLVWFVIFALWHAVLNLWRTPRWIPWRRAWRCRWGYA